MRKRAGRSPDQIELERILRLPVEEQIDAEDLEIFSFENFSAHAYGRGDRALSRQAQAVLAFDKCGGALLPIGVGLGKTGTALMILQRFLSSGQGRKALLLFPVHLIQALVERHIPEWRDRIHLPTTFHHFSGRGRHARMSLAQSDAPGIYVYPYTLLSQETSLDELGAIDADLVVADEVHRLKNPRAASTKRVLHFLGERKPRFVGMSGTITSKGIMDYWHLIDAALGEGSPLPRRSTLAYTWSMALDSGAVPSPGLLAGSLGPLVAWAQSNYPDEDWTGRRGIEKARTAYRLRLTSAPGVVASGEDRPSTSLVFEDLRAPEPGPELKKLLTTLREDYETPQGEPIDHAIHVYKWEFELAGAGFYNSLVWPDPEEYARTHHIPVSESEDLLARARLHHEIQKEYRAELRDFFKDAPIGLDQPKQVGLSIAHHGARDVGPTLARLWQRLRDADFPGRPERLKIPVRVDDFKIRAAVAWAEGLKGQGGVIWYFNREVGRWLHEMIPDSVFCPAGAQRELEAIGDPVRGGKGDRVCIASIKAHGEGRNLQAFENQLFVQWPRAAPLAEQTLGRLHRTGQMADELLVHNLIGLDFDEVNRAATLADAIYIQETTGAAQKVLYADYVEMPKIFSPEILRKRGAKPLSLDVKVWAATKARFRKGGLDKETSV